ncbi:MAG: TonB-dependent receptor, partial [Pseudomonadota bacterium]
GRNRIHGFVLLTIGLVCVIHGGESAASDDHVLIDETGEEDDAYKTVVTALGFEDDEFDSPRSMEVLEEEDIQRKAGETLPGLLEETTGIFVQKTAHGHGAPIIRGVIGINNLILFNEIKLNNSTWRTGPIEYLNLVDPFSVEKIEILRGPGSLMYGSDAIGGVISIYGKSPRFSDKPLLSPALAGKFSSADLSYAGHFSLGGSCSRAATVFGGTYKQFNDLVAGPDVGEQEFTGYRDADFDYNMKIRLFDAGTLELGWYMVRLFDAGRTDQLEPNNRLRTYDNARDLGYVRYIGDHGGDLDYRLTLSYQRYEDIAQDIRFASAALDVIERNTWDVVEVNTLGFTSVVTKGFLDRQVELSGGIDIYSDWVDAHSFRLDEGVPAAKAPLFPSGSRYTSYEVYVLARWNIQKYLKGLHLWGGGRFNYTTALSPDMPGYGDINYSKPGGTGSGGLYYTYKSILNTGVSFSEGYRSPKLSETSVFGDMGSYFEIPNPDLGPERAETLEVYARAWWKYFDVNVAFFTTWFRDLLDKNAAAYDGMTEIDDKPVMRTENLDSALLLGTEASLVFYFGRLMGVDGLRLRGNITWLRGNKESCDGGECETEPMTRIPPLFFTAALGYYDDDGGDFCFSIEALLRGAAEQDRLSSSDESDVRIPEGGTPGWKTLSLRGMVEYKKRVVVTMLFENLLNETYKIHGSGLHEPGTGITVSLALKR